MVVLIITTECRIRISIARAAATFTSCGHQPRTLASDGTEAPRRHEADDKNLHLHRPTPDNSCDPSTPFPIEQAGHEHTPEHTWSSLKHQPEKLINTDIGCDLTPPAAESHESQDGARCRVRTPARNASRSDAGGPPGVERELSAWSPTGRANFHTPERFGFIEFVA